MHVSVAGNKNTLDELLMKQAASLMEKDNRIAHYFGLFCGWGYFWGISLLPV